jgi:hypothetical protein
MKDNVKQESRFDALGSFFIFNNDNSLLEILDNAQHTDRVFICFSLGVNSLN